VNLLKLLAVAVGVLFPVAGLLLYPTIESSFAFPEYWLVAGVAAAAAMLLWRSDAEAEGARGHKLIPRLLVGMLSAWVGWGACVLANGLFDFSEPTVVSGRIVGLNTYWDPGSRRRLGKRRYSMDVVVSPPDVGIPAGQLPFGIRDWEYRTFAINEWQYRTYRIGDPVAIRFKQGFLGRPWGVGYDVIKQRRAEGPETDTR
jgi:hypothetical protein